MADTNTNMTVATPRDYWLSPNALHIERNAMGNPDYIQASCISGAQMLVYIKDVISYDAGHNYRRWVLQASPTVFNTHTEKYVYAAIPRNDTQNVATVVFPSELLDIYGKNEQQEQVGLEDYYYIFLQGILSSSGDNGTVQRDWLEGHTVVTGYLSSDEAISAGPDESEWFHYSAVDNIVTFLKDLTMKDDVKFRELFAKALSIVSGGRITFEGQEGSLSGIAHADTNVESETDIVTPKYMDDHALSKSHDDKTDFDIELKNLRANGTIDVFGNLTAHNGLSVGDYLKGVAGANIDFRGNSEFESVKVRSYLEAAELIINRLSAIEGDQILTEADTIERVVDLGDNCYGLYLHPKWEGYFTAQAEGSVLKGIINNLGAIAMGKPGQGAVAMYTSWMRVNSVNPASNYIEVTLYPDEETPAMRNFPPCELMKIARWGSQTDQRRQSCLYLSSTDGRIVHLSGVTKPIIDQTNFASTFGTMPDFIKQLTDRDGNPLPLRENLDYAYIGGLVVQDVIRIDFKGKPIVTYVDRGQWYAAANYYCEAKNPTTGVWETSDVWYMGCKWRCCKNLTKTEPRWNNTDWAMVEGNPDFTVEFADTDYLFDPDRFAVTLTIIAKLHNIDVTSDILDADVIWTRYSEDADGNERVASDNAWALKRAGAGKSIHLTADDVDFNGYVPNVLKYTATVTLRDGMGEETATEQTTFEF